MVKLAINKSNQCVSFLLRVFISPCGPIQIKCDEKRNTCDPLFICS